MHHGVDPLPTPGPDGRVLARGTHPESLDDPGDNDNAAEVASKITWRVPQIGTVCPGYYTRSDGSLRSYESDLPGALVA